jgi:UDP-2,3-diacylglucosamine hydrolase
MSNGKKIYFASDFHLGVPDKQTSRAREKRIIRWLDEIKHDAEEIFLVGDIFDFWFEYKKAVPKGFVRLQGKIAELTDAGIPVHYFTGNHDMWVFDYIPEELGVKLYREPIERTFNGKKFLIGHGDGLGPGDSGYKFIKKVFSSKVCQWLFGILHPDLGIGLADYWSGKSRVTKALPDEVFLGEDKEWLVQYCKEVSQTRTFDFFIFGHRHLPLDIKISERSRYINLGDWIRYNTYAVFDGQELHLKKFEPVATADSPI